MEKGKSEEKAKKKAYKKARRKATRPWKGLTFLNGILALILILVSIITTMFDNTITVLAGGTFSKLENEDEDAQYYTTDFASREEKKAYEDWLCEQVEAEGAVLLLNKDNALPLEKGSDVSCFSSSSVDLIYGGTGSGNMNTAEAPTLKEALTDSGLNVNETLWDFYSEGDGSEYVRDQGEFLFFSTGATAVDVPWDAYTDEVKDSVVQYGDAAIVVISRVGGEGSDLTFKEYNYLELTQDEKDMLAGITEMKKAGEIDKIVILLNSANAIQLDFMKENAYDIDACLWIGDVGQTGVNAVADILTGIVNPSGRLVDTFCYDNYSSPAMVNFETTIYSDAEKKGLPDKAMKYVIYQEGIYVGYRYYETRYEDYVMGTGNAGDYRYNDEVAYTFGYGLSYTDFEYSDMNVSYNEDSDQYEICVKVTNVGDTYSGKETVQVYSQSPYTEYDQENNVEKAAVILCGFEKTDVLAPGESEMVTIYVEKRDLASYDAYGAGTYILDAGDYYLTVAENAHNAVDNILAAKGFTPESTEGRMDKEGNGQLTFKWNNPVLDNTSYAVSKIGYPITNQFDDADLNRYEGSPTEITYLKRSDWEGTFPTGIVQLKLTEQMVEDLALIRYDVSDYDEMEMPVFGAENGLKLIDMMGLAYDDPKWEELLDQISYSEMTKFVGDAFHWTMPIVSIEAPATRDENGPQGLTASLMHMDIDALACTSEDVMAATFNRELIADIGRMIGTDCLDAGVSCLYGPGNNTHRTPYGGRNYEYYSEDGYLSGQISASENTAIQAMGVNVMMKHFALNDCESDREGLGTFANEQSIREIYLKAFQAPIEEAKGSGVMTAYNRIGCVWAGGDYNLITNVLCNEWGCTGIITDNAFAYMNAADCLMAGGSLFDGMLNLQTRELNNDYKNDAVIANQLRKAVHRNLYRIVNSCAMNGIGSDTVVKAITPSFVIASRILAIVFSGLFILSLVMWMKKKSRFYWS